MVQNNQKKNNISSVKFIVSPNFSVHKQCFMGTQLFCFQAVCGCFRTGTAALGSRDADCGRTRSRDMCGELGRCRRTLWPTCQTGCHSEGVLVLLQFVTEKWVISLRQCNSEPHQRQTDFLAVGDVALLGHMFRGQRVSIKGHFKF